MRLHWSKEGRHLWQYGRAWLRSEDKALASWEWVFGSSRCGCYFEACRNDDHGIGFNIAIPFVLSFYLTLTMRPFAWLATRLLPKTGYDDRRISVTVHDGAIWWTVWRCPMGGWDRSVPRWREGSFHVDDFLFGKTQYERRVLSTHAVQIAMPEGLYPATVELDECTWRRPRWFAKQQRGCRVDIPKGIPFPGKGENSYDCGDDALFSLSSHASTVEAAIGAVVESVLRSRRRHGGTVMWSAN